MRFFTLLCFALLSTTLAGQTDAGIWKSGRIDQQASARSGKRNHAAKQHQAFTLNIDALRERLQAAPREFSRAARRRPLALPLPLPDGTTEMVKVVYSPVMEPGLETKMPQFKTYRAEGTDRILSARFDWTALGFNALVRTREGVYFITPHTMNQQTEYAVFWYRDVAQEAITLNNAACGTTTVGEEELVPKDITLPKATSRSSGDFPLYTYTMALACTGEYASLFDNDSLAVLSAIINANNALNALYETEVGVRFILVEGNENLIFLNPDTDPYENGNQGTALLSQNGPVIANEGGIPATAYDIGHLLTGRCNDVGGVAGGTLCSAGASKAAGITCNSARFTTNISTFAHEVGHQLSAPHTFSNCPGSGDQLGLPIEIGGGSTIMAYGPACGSQAYASRDFYFHGASIDQMYFFTRSTRGEGCGTIIETDNRAPQIQLDYEDGFFIPISTPFELDIIATDADNDSLTYCWEQFDAGLGGGLGDPQGNSPSFRSFPPTVDSKRYFPTPNFLFSSQNSPAEVLPTYSRDLTFRCTVRDHHPGSGAVIWEEVAFKATDKAGPFVVNYPNLETDTLLAGTTAKIQWDVANTDQAPVNAEYVNILLFLNRDQESAITLVSSTPNDGEELVSIPDLNTPNAYIRIEAADNIFFDVSDNNFTIVRDTVPRYFLTLEGITGSRLCLPNEASVVLSTQSLNDFNSPIEFSIIDTLPEGATANFSKTTVNPGESTSLTLSFENTIPSTTLPLRIQAIAEEGDTLIRQIEYRLVNNDFSELRTQDPTNGTEDILLQTDFRWDSLANADSYLFEISDDPRFGATTLERAESLVNTSYTPGFLFEENTIYFWRVAAENECGIGNFTPPSTFQTSAVTCTPVEATDVPINISGTGRPTIESNIFISESGTISDVNIPLLTANYQPVKSLRMTLISPAGTEVVLYDQTCGNTVRFTTGFDDQAPQAIQCPPDDGIVFQPIGNLSDFIGENTQGNWTLRIEVVEPGFGASGGLENWSLEFCATLNPNDPALVNKDTLFVPPGQANIISQRLLSVTDEDNSTDEVRYRIVTPPSEGSLFFYGTRLDTGDYFTQSAILDFGIAYENENEAAENDAFSFIVEDGTGGWIPLESFPIVISPDAVVKTTAVDPETVFQILPNPARNWIRITANGFGDDANVRLLNLQGQLLKETNLQHESTDWRLPKLPAGVYLLQVIGQNHQQTKKLMVRG